MKVSMAGSGEGFEKGGEEDDVGLCGDLGDCSAGKADLDRAGGGCVGDFSDHEC